MKKLVVLIFIFLLITGTEKLAYSETNDYMNLTFDELSAIKKSVDSEYYSRTEAEAQLISPGVYIIGEDIPEGTLYYRVAEADINNNCGDYSYFPNLDAYLRNNTKNAYRGHVYYGSIGSCFFSRGNVLIVSGASMLFSLVEENVDNIPSYEIPAGTRVRPGKYIVGKDLPSGYYYILASSVESSYFAVYDTESLSNLKYGSANEVYRVTVDKNNVGILVHLEPDNAIVIDDNDVIMRKREEETLHFD